MVSSRRGVCGRVVRPLPGKWGLLPIIPKLPNPSSDLALVAVPLGLWESGKFSGRPGRDIHLQAVFPSRAEARQCDGGFCDNSKTSTVTDQTTGSLGERSTSQNVIDVPSRAGHPLNQYHCGIMDMELRERNIMIRQMFVLSSKNTRRPFDEKGPQTRAQMFHLSCFWSVLMLPPLDMDVINLVSSVNEVYYTP